ncbi:MAG: hypothetical protein R3F19_13455 [Verrucomicrobiales bacterium]
MLEVTIGDSPLAIVDPLKASGFLEIAMFDWLLRRSGSSTLPLSMVP